MSVTDVNSTMYPSVFDNLGFVRCKKAELRQDEECFNEYLGRSQLAMKEHQWEGVQWALQQERYGHIITVGDRQVTARCGLLADEMGLGKTIQMIGTMVCNPLPHTLIVVPRALLEQWKKAYVTTTGDDPIIFHGQERHKYSLEDLNDARVVITTYHHIADAKSSKAGLKKQNALKLAQASQGATPVAETKESPTILHKIEWNRVIYDEAHHLRNDGTAIGAGARKLHAEIRWLVTGTPIQNRKSDFYSLCEQMGLPRAYYSNSDNLLTLVRNFIKKRTKMQAGIQLPELNCTTETVAWGSPAERDLSENIHSLLQFSHLNKSRVDNAIANLDMPHLALLIRARQMCVMPALMTHRMKDYVITGAVENGDEMFRGMTASSKLDAVTQKIVSRKDNGRGKLVFCHFRGEIDFLKDQLTREGMSVETFDGRVKTSRRTAILESSCDVLILQIQTGCEGLNLQQFSEIYFVSPHWNPAVEDQAVARCHRIGQSEKVEVFRFSMEGFDEEGKTKTLDEYSANVQDLKRDVMSIIDGEEVEAPAKTEM